ncbi:glycosyltransferase [Caproiciproducens galactitolivorans]|uniref:N-acetylgalactosamine-N, N'-diacetylbacillosaminyl-diphospho-undecaprenol 4-alpha-N-acetylgalactosaminyltransferase n=1 Tax=Caproiciproducens galactitolivorans TaxID=642589 RepID=A0A4Z0YMA8_9FIRM|nr:glycosyltransferase [Caproiciproducens galactitolivorans]QEY34422.1 glycosyltransferase [Caproiciproducens galactitolivorans]TGJ77802.1 N-acetylgalactosamine-N,N'-diacetylbacillosaminyl-diphospho-undecaprenol 4-alpha-N-acetylgalactosaminyltransferase [Caproiciproducens galactitolivorans]
MTKKRVLFINYSLHSGGIEKSLVTVLSLFDYENYDVDLQLFANEGLFLSRVPAKVNLLPPLFPAEYKLNIRQAFFKLILKGHPLIAFCRLMVTFAGLRGTMGERLTRMWNVERRFIRPAKKEYDAVIAFMEGQPIYYAVTKVKSKTKIGFIHGDYVAMGLNKEFDYPFIKQLNALCTVSESCKSALDSTFPGFSGKFHVIYNIISATFMRNMAEEPADFEDGFTGLRVLSIARLSHQKGLDIALPAVAALKKKGLRFKWYIIGVGPEEANLRNQIHELGIEEYVRFLGERSNPYPYLKACDIYMQPSRFEGKSIAVDEAMVMARPILLTNFSTAADQIDSGKNGLIVPMTSEGIAEGLEDLLLNEERRAQFTAALEKCDYTNEYEINKLYALIGGASL